MAYGSSAFGSESYGGSSNITLLGVITYFLSGHLSKANITITFTLDAKIVSRPEKTFTLDAIIVSRLEKTFTLDTSLQKSFSKTFIINAYLKKFDSEKTFTINSKLIHRREKSFNVNAILQKTFIKTFKISARCYVKLNWLSQWKYRKNIIVCGSIDGTLINYAMRITVNKGAGTDSSTNIYCNNRCKDDFSDIRFTKQDGTTLLSYSIASYTSGVSADVLVKIDYIPTDPNSTNIYMYYGNSSAITASILPSVLLTAFEANHVNTRYNILLESNWKQINHDDSLWDIGNTPFHSDDFGEPHCPSYLIYTDTNYTDFPYNTPVYLRKEFYSDDDVVRDIKLGIDNNSTGYLNGNNIGSNVNSGCTTYWSHTISNLSIVKGRNIIAWKISGDVNTNAFDFIFSSLTELSCRNQTVNEPTFCTISAEESISKGNNIMRTHRVGLRIING